MSLVSLQALGADDFKDSPLTPTSENVYRSILGGVADYAVFQEPTVEIDNILSQMFWVFNISVFAVLSWLLFALLMQKMLVAGNEGEIKSNKYNDTMAVIRAAGSLCGLLPIIKGFCLAQVLVACLGMQASFIADEVNEAANEYTFVNGSVSGYRPDPIKINMVVNQIAESVTCSAAMASYYSEHPYFQNKYLVSLTDTSSQTSVSSDTAFFRWSYQNAQGKELCGSIEMAVNSDKYLGSWGDPTGTFGEMSNYQKQQRDRILNAHKAAVKATHDFLTNGLSAGIVLPGEKADANLLANAYKQAKIQYHAALHEAFKKGGAELKAEWDQQIKARYQSDVEAFAAKRGWIYNGFTWLDKSRSESFMSKLASTGPTTNTINVDQLEHEFIRERLDRSLMILREIKHEANRNQSDAAYLSQTQKQVGVQSSQEAYNMDIEFLMNSFYEGADAEAVSSMIFSNAINTALVDTQFNFIDYDPITNLQHLGYRLVNTGWFLIFSSISIDVASKVITSEKASESFLRQVLKHVSGGISEGAVSALETLIGHIVSLMFTVGPLLVAIGSVLAYWLPALPFFMWNLAVLGNYLLVLIAFMAAPLWMAAHAMPEGDGFAGEHAKQGWLTMITILARPSIMVITWHVALVLMREMGKYTSLFLEYAPMANSEAFVGLWGALVMVVIYVIFEMVIVFRCTSLIYEVPDQMPIYYGSSNTTANENIGEDRGQSMIAGWQSHTQNTASTASTVAAGNSNSSPGSRNNLM